VPLLLGKNLHAGHAILIDDDHFAGLDVADKLGVN